MNARYYNTPPSLPEYFYKWFPETAFAKLIAWSEKEYRDALILFSRRGALKTVKFLNEEYSGMRILAEMPGFRKIASLISEDVWNKHLTRDQRRFICRAYELYEMLKKSSPAG